MLCRLSDEPIGSDSLACGSDAPTVTPLETAVVQGVPDRAVPSRNIDLALLCAASLPTVSDAWRAAASRAPTSMAASGNVEGR